MDRSILFFTLSLVSFYLILDEFVGKKRISSILDLMGSSEEAPFPGNEVDPQNPFENEDIERGRLTSNELLNPAENESRIFK